MSDFTADDFDEVEILERKRWTVTNDAEADWALAKLRRARWEIDRLAERAADERRRIDERFTELAKVPQRDAAFFEHLLIEYRMTVTPAKGKTYKLLNGELSVKAGSESVDIIDAEAFLDWAEGNERLDLIRYKAEPNKSEIKAAIKAGETIPGAELVVSDEKYVVSTGSGEPPAVLPMPEGEAA